MKYPTIETPRILAKRKVRSRLKTGWCAWVSPTRSVVWARYREEAGRIDTSTISPPELAVLDEVLMETS